MHHRTLFIAALTTIVFALGAPASEAQGSAQSYLERRHHEVNRLLREAATDDAARRRRSERLTGILNDLLDYDELSRRALGEHWESRSPEERTRFVALLRQLVERNYESNLERIVDYEVSYETERRRGEHTLVSTMARSRTHRRQPPVEIEYTLHRVENRWRVIDVQTDGVGMVQNYRNQFNRIISREGWDQLIARMERRLADQAG